MTEEDVKVDFEKASNIYMVFVDDGESWQIGMIGVPAGTLRDEAVAYAEKQVLDLNPDVKVPLVIPFELVEDAVERFREVLRDNNVQAQSPC